MSQVVKPFGCLALLSFAYVAMSAPCELSAGGETFDLSPLAKRGSDSYSVKDVQAMGGQVQHTYFFNFCNNIAPPTKECGADQAAVFQTLAQTSPKPNLCYTIGAKFDTAEQPTTTLYDEKNPARGVTIVYKPGDKCGNNVFRKFLVNVICDPTDKDVNIPDDEPIFEDPMCEYRLTLKSIHGCPTNCGTVNGELCNGVGECAYDNTLGKSRCFCFDGSFGDDCTIGSKWNPGNTTAIIFMAILAIALLVGLTILTVLVWKRVQSLRLDPEAYSTMGGEMAMKTENMSDDDTDDEDEV